MAIDFPLTSGQPTDGSFIYTFGNITYRWNGVSWSATGGGAGDGSGEYLEKTGSTASRGLFHDISNDQLVIKDETKLAFGTGDPNASGGDYFFTWTSSGTSGDLVMEPNSNVSATNNVYIRANTSQNGIAILDNGSTEVFHNGNKKLETTTSGITVTGDITTTGKILYSNVYSTTGDLPSAGTYHGMFAHVHAENHGYFAHAGAWTQLLDTGSNLSELADVAITAPSASDVLTWDGANWGPAAPTGGSSYSNSDVDSHLNQGTASTGEVLSWNGSDYDWVAQSGGGSSTASSVLVSPETFNITVPSATNTTYSKYYTVSGNDRYGQVGGNDFPVKMYTGDTVTFDTSALSGSHPLYIRVSDGGASVSNPAATGEGTASISWTPAATGIYYYQCGDHPEMIGVIYVEDPINAEPTIDVVNSNIGGVWSYGDTGDDPLNWGEGSSVSGHNIDRNNLPQYMPAYSDTAGNLPPIANPPDHPDPVSLAFDARFDTWLNVASSIDNGVIELTFTNPLCIDYFSELTIGYDGNVQPGYNGGNYTTTTTLTNDIQEIVLKPNTYQNAGLQLDNLVFKTVTASGATGRLYYVIASFGGSNGMMVYKSSKVGIGGAGKTLYKHDASVNLQLGAEHLNSIIAVNTLIPRSIVLPIHYMCREGDTITILDVGTGKLNRNDDGTFPNAFSPGYPSYDYNPGNATNCPIVIYPSLEQGIQQTGPAPWSGDPGGVNGSNVYWLPTTNTTGKFWGEEMHGMPFVVNKNGQSIKLVFCGIFYGWRILS